MPINVEKKVKMRKPIKGGETMQCKLIKTADESIQLIIKKDESLFFIEFFEDGDMLFHNNKNDEIEEFRSGIELFKLLEKFSD